MTETNIYLAQHERIADLCTENARLQAKVEESETVQGLSDEAIGHASVALSERAREVELLKRERDGYKAQSQVRGEALAENAEAYHATHPAAGEFKTCMDAMCKSNRAAIAITPEQAREKERR